MDQELLDRGGIRVERDDAALTVTLDRPEVRNAMRPSTWAALAEVGASVPDDVRVVVVRGAGPAFCAGLDRRLLSGEQLDGEPPVTELFGSSREAFDATIASYQEGFTWLRDPRFISVAVVQGFAIGAGFQLALACDLRVVAADVAFSMREPALGIIPDLSGTKPLVEAIGYSRALEITATTRYVHAEEAYSVGLANRVVALGDLDTALKDMVASLTAHLPGAVRDTKRVLLGAAERTLEEQRAHERAIQFQRFTELASGR